MKLLLVGLVFFVCGCAKIILPYEEAQLCRKGADSGLCGSVSDVYDYSIKNKRK